MRRMSKCQDSMLTGHQDTQIQEASGERYSSCDPVAQSTGTGSIGNVAYQGATGSGFSFNRPMNFTLPPVSEQYYMGGQPETQESQYSAFSRADYVPCMQGQRQMDCNYSPMLPGQQQNTWKSQQPLQQSQSYRGRADWFVVHQSQRDLGQQVSSLPSDHQEQFDPSNGDAAGSWMLLCQQQSMFHQMPLWLHGQQGTADSCTPQESSSPVKTHPANNSQASGT